MNFQFEADMNKVAEAWELSKKSLATNINKQKSGEWKENVPYYSLQLNGKTFEGERPFGHRWKTLTEGFDFADKKVLECGCNMGLFASFLLKLGQAQSVIAFERDETMFNAANMFAKAVGVNPTIHLLNVNSEKKWEDVIGNDFDVVLLLSVFKYFKDQDRVMKFITKANDIIFEGEVNKEKEDISYFTSYGYKKHKIIGSSERNRPIIHFSAI